MSYYRAYICENGHAISSLSDSCPDKHCAKCGAAVINKCPECNGMIRGRSRSEYGFAAKYTVPSYCIECGKPYPWTRIAIQSTIYMLEESDLSYEEQNKLKEILPDIISETPRTALAAVRFKKAIISGGKFVADFLRQFAIDFGCEYLKNQLDLH
ncbi:MAG: DUF2321 domain-containing protein [Oscillospiraceae bacterium]|nr:DUF2321 domain-containing protein [Oscillospiraceae bacterium]